MSNIRTLLYAELLLTIVVVGLMTFYLGNTKALWLSYALGIGIFVRYLLQISTQPKIKLPHSIPSFIISSIFFTIFMLSVTIVMSPNIWQFMVGLKIYLPIWSLMFVTFSVVRLDPERFMDTLEKGVLALVVLQLPFVLHQHFVVAPTLTTTTPWDAVVGTFGGQWNGGGSSGTLMLFVIIGILVTIELYQTQRLGRFMAGFYITLSVVILLLGEVKAVFLLLPLTVMIQQIYFVQGKPIKFIISMFIVLLILLAIYQTSEAMYWSTSSESKSINDRINEMFSYFIDPYGYDYLTGEVSRGASLAIWWNDHHTDFLHRLIGHGAAASRSRSTISLGEIASRFAPLDVSSTALAQLLWDIGVIGTLLFSLTIVISGLKAFQLAVRAWNNTERMRMMTISAIFALMLPLMFYNKSLVDGPVEQIILAVLLGLLWERSQLAGARFPVSSRSDGRTIGMVIQRRASGPNLDHCKRRLTVSAFRPRLRRRAARPAGPRQ